MKKLIVILSLLFTLILAGILYGKYGQSDEVENVTAEEIYMNPYPAMPDFIPAPMPGFPLPLF